MMTRLKTFAADAIRHPGTLVTAALCAAILTLPLTLPQPSQIGAVCMWLMAVTLAFAVAAVSVLLRRKNLPTEKIFLLLVIGLGLVYMVAITPLSAPDEGAHHRVTLRLAAQVLHGNHTVDAAYVDDTGLTPHENTAGAMLRLVNGLFTEGLSGDMVDLGNTLGTTYPLSYAPQALMAVVCMLLGLNGLWVFVLGSMANLAFYATMTYLAIKRIPRGKPLMMLVALLPMALQQCSSLSPDAFINGLSFLFIGQAVAAIQGDGLLSRRDKVALAVTGILLSPAKAVYAALLLLLLLIPGKRFSGRKQQVLYVGGTLAAAVVLTVMAQLGLFAGRTSGVTAALGTTGDYTVSWVLTHPGETARLVLSSLSQGKLMFYLHSMIGSSLSGLTLEMRNVYVNLFTFTLLFAALVGEKDKRPMPLWHRGACIVIPGIVVLAVMGTMLLAWTRATDTFIEGVQGRYFLPVAPLLLFALSNRAILPARRLDAIYGAMFLLLNVLCLMDIFAAL